MLGLTFDLQATTQHMNERLRLNTVAVYCKLLLLLLAFFEFFAGFCHLLASVLKLSL